MNADTDDSLALGLIRVHRRNPWFLFRTSEPAPGLRLGFGAEEISAGNKPLYVASFGPACWIEARMKARPRLPGGFWHDAPIVERVYWPIVWLAIHGPDGADMYVCWWASLGVPSNKPTCLYQGGDFILIGEW